MAQTGIPGTLFEIDVTKLGEASGPGGLIGAAVYGYQYFPLKDTVNFEETVPIIIVDKIRIPSNLPNRTEPNEVENQTSIIDVYVGIPVDPSIISGIYSTVNVEPIFIPANLITKIVSLPKVECCDVDDAIVTSPSLIFNPSSIDLGTYVTSSPFPTDLVKPITMQYTNLTAPVQVDVTNSLGTAEDNWQWKKAGGTTYVEAATNPLYYSLSELITGGGYLDIDIKFNNPGDAVVVGSNVGYQLQFSAVSTSAEVADAQGSATITIDDTSRI